MEGLKAVLDIGAKNQMLINIYVHLIEFFLNMKDVNAQSK
jgi:hypothetical protein